MKLDLIHVIGEGGKRGMRVTTNKAAHVDKNFGIENCFNTNSFGDIFDVTASTLVTPYRMISLHYRGPVIFKALF